MTVSPHSGIIDFGTFTSPVPPNDGIQGEVPAPLSAQDGYILSTSGWIPNTGGGGTPGGSDTQLQFNNAGVFGGASGLTTNGTELTIASGTKTASAPFINATQTWNNSGVTFTGFRFNATDTASAAASLLLDLQVGGTSQFRVRKDGVASVGNSSGGGGLIVVPAGSFQPFLSRDGLGGLILGNVGGNNLPVHIGAADVSITRRGAANFIHGGSDAGLNSATVTITIASPAVITWNGHRLSTGTPVTFTTTGALPTGITAGTTYYVIFVSDSTFQIATTLANALAGTAINTSGTQSGTHTGNRWAITQRLSVQGVTGVTDRIGSDFFIQGSQGTGSGAGGSIIFQVAPAGGSGTAQNSLATALTIDSARNVFVNGTTGNDFVRLSSGTNVSQAYFVTNALGGKILINGNDTTNITIGINSGVILSSTTVLGWTSFANMNSGFGIDLALWRDASNTLALRNVNNGQTFRLYGRFTDITNNFERFFITAPTTSGAAVQLGTQKGATTGAARALEFQTDSVTRLTIATNGDITATNNISAPNINSMTSVIAPVLGAL